jgi:hypothetical protein
MSWWRQLFTRDTQKSDFQAATAEHWRALRTLDLRRRATGGWSDEREREAHQLLQAAVLYQAHCFAHFGAVVHEKWRLPPLGPRVGAYAGDDDELPFGLFLRPNETIGQMHLASAAMRLPVAMERTIAAKPKAARPFTGMPALWNGSAWLRGTLKDLFPAVRLLGHCADRPLGATREERLGRSIAIVMVLRDDFGHGEIGDPATVKAGQDTKDYVRYRNDVLNDLYTCRIVEAQQELVRWATDCLT